jgi:AcrR family transcriptional regulator
MGQGKKLEDVGVAGKRNLLCCEADDGEPKKSASERVFDAARELFYRRGVRAVGVDEIVVQAGVTKPSLYRAYASKDELVAACLDRAAAEGRAAFDALMASNPDNPLEQLRSVVRYYADKMTDPHFRGCPLSNTAVEFPEPDHPGRVVLETCKADTRTRIGNLTRQLAIPDPDGLADGLVLIMEGAMANHHIFGTQGPSAALVATADALIHAQMRAVAPV